MFPSAGLGVLWPWGQMCPHPRVGGGGGGAMALGTNLSPAPGPGAQWPHPLAARTPAVPGLDPGGPCGGGSGDRVGLGGDRDGM